MSTLSGVVYCDKSYVEKGMIVLATVRLLKRSVYDTCAFCTEIWLLLLLQERRGKPVYVNGLCSRVTHTV